MNSLSTLKLSVALTATFLIFHTSPATPRARDLGIPFEGLSGNLNSITDVAGVEVGYSTIINGDGKLVVGEGPIRTGVTAILPRGKESAEPVFAGCFSLNGNGEMTGMAWVEESGFLAGPVMITNTHSVGTVHEAVIRWQVNRGNFEHDWSLPVVAETWDGHLNDINGFHVKPEHIYHAIESAEGDTIKEGNVGGGTGMVCFEFKGGTGTASRIIRTEAGTFTIGVLVQANFGRRHQLTIAGVPVGKTLTEKSPYTDGRNLYEETGSLIAVVATDAPLLPIQLKRLAKRVGLGMARTGATSGNGSGDLFIAFSTTPTEESDSQKGLHEIRFLSNDHISGLFSGVALATEEAIVNALVAAESMTGRDGHEVVALPHVKLKALLKHHRRLEK